MIGTWMAKRAIADAFEAMNQQDVDRFLANWRDDAVFVFPGDIPESGTFEGKPAIEDWFRRYFERFPEIRYDVTDICARDCFDLAGNNVLAAHWTVRHTNREGRTGTNSGVTVVTAQGGKVARVQDFYFDTGAEFRRDWGAA